MNVFDASALLAYLQREQGSDVVSEHLARGGACSTASWSETAQEVLAAGGSWPRARALLNSHPLTADRAWSGLPGVVLVR